MQLSRLGSEVAGTSPRRASSYHEARHEFFDRYAVGPGLWRDPEHWVDLAIVTAGPGSSELLADFRSNGYRLFAGGHPLVAEEVDEGARLGPLVLFADEPPDGSSSFLQRLSPMPSHRVQISSWDELKELAALASGRTDELRNPDLGRTLRALEQAGARLYVAGADYQEGQDLLHRKLLVIDNHDVPAAARGDQTPPQLAGACGVYHDQGRGTLMVSPPDAEAPSRVDSLETARYFVLGEGEAPSPVAAELRALGERGLGFARGKQEIGALGAYRWLSAGESVALTVDKIPVGTVTAELQVPPEAMRAVDYARARPECDPDILVALALPSGLGQEEVLGLLARVCQREAARFSIGRYSSFSEGRLSRQPSRAAMILSELCEGRRDGQKLPELVDRYLELSRHETIQSRWLTSAVPHLLEHPDAADRLVELGKLGGSSFQETLTADAMLGDDESRRAFASLAVKGPGGGVAVALRSYPRLQRQRWTELTLEEDARAVGSLVSRLGEDIAWSVRERLRPGDVDRFLRELALCDHPEKALLCLAPGGHPDLPEPLEVREQAARLVGRSRPTGVGLDLNAWFRDEDNTVHFGARQGLDNYSFLLTLPERDLLADARLLAGAEKLVGQDLARELTSEARAGKLGRLTGPEILERLAVERALLGSSEGAVASVRAGIPDHEQRLLRMRQLRERFGQEIYPQWGALTTPLPPETPWEDGLGALTALHKHLPEKACEAYVALVDAVREGAWQGLGLAQAAETFLRNAALGDLEKAMQGLATPPAQGTSVGAVHLDGGQVTVGGVRLRARR